MSVDIATLAIKVDATETDKGAKSLDNLTAAGGRTEAQTEKLTSSQTKLAAEGRKAASSIDLITAASGGASGGLSTMKAALAGAVGGAVVAGLEQIAKLIGEIAHQTIDLVKDAALISARFETLGVVLHVAGNNAGYTAAQMDDLEKAVRRNGITGIEARESLTKMATAHLDLAKAAKLSRVAQDVAVVGNINSSEAFGRLIDGLQEGNVLMLRTLGLNVDFQAAYERTAKTLHTTAEGLTESEKAQARLNVVLDEGKNFAGIYEQAMGTAGKQVTSMTRYSEELKQTLGDMFLPETTSLIFDQADALKAMNEQLAELSRSDVAQFIGGVLVVTFKVLEVSITGVIYVGGQLLRLFGAMASQAAALARGDFAAVGDIGKSFAKDYAAAADSYGKLLNRQLGLADASAKATGASEAERIARGGATRAATTQAEHLEALAKALDKVAPKQKKIAELQAGIALIRADLAKGIGDPAAEKAAIAEGEKGIATLKKSTEHHDRHAESLAREAAAMVANTAGALVLAAAYLQGDQAALKAEADRKAATAATTKGISIAAQAQRQLNLDIADAIVNGAKSAATTQAEADAQSAANDAVQYGNVASEVAQKNMQAELALRPLLAAAALAQGVALDAATAAIEAQRKAIADRNAEDLKSRNLASAQANADTVRLANLDAELTLLGKTNAERAIALAIAQEEQRQTASGYDPKTATDKQRAAHDAAAGGVGSAAGAAENAKIAQDNYNGSLQSTLDLLQEIAAHTASVAQGLGEGFGRAGDAIGALIGGLSQYKAVQEQLRLEQDRATKAATAGPGATEKERAASLKRLGEIEELYAKKRQNAEVESNLAALDSFKHLFSAKSSAYKVLTAIETTYRAVQLAGQIREMATDAIATAKSIANAFASGAANAAAGAAKMFQQLGIFAFPVVAAMGAVLVGLGLKAFGGGSSPSIPSAEDRQKSQGTGTVLGDATAKSESIAHSLDLVAANTNKDLEYSNGMLRALRNIDQNIGALTDVLARQLGVGGAFDTSGAKFGTQHGTDYGALLLGTGGIGLALSQIPIIGGVIKSLFGTKKTTSLLDQGLSFDPQSLDAILGGGLSGDSYQDVATQTKKKFFGITYSNKTKTSTQTTPLGDDILAEMQRVIGSLKEGVLAAAGALGVEGADAVLKSFTVNLGTISFKDKTGQEIQDELNAIFGKLGDDLSAAVFPAISGLQKAGEGAFETLVRVARQYQVIDVTLSSIGKTFGAVGVSSLAARESLIDLFGTLDDFVSETQFFADNFLSEAERIAPIQAAVIKEFQRLGVTGVNTKEEFKALVLGLDLTTAAGQQAYASLLQVAPAFSKVIDYLTTGSKDLTDAKNDLSKAYEREAGALQDTKDKFEAFADSLRKFRQSLDTGPSALLSPEAQYNATKAAFVDTAAKARLGDATALGDLQGVSQAYLDASKAYYASSGRYFQDLAAVKAAVEAAGDTASRTASNADQQLAVLKAQVSGLITINESVLSVHDAILALQAAMAGVTNTATGTPFSSVSGTGLPSIGGTTTTPTGTSFNAAGYLSANPDVAAAYPAYQAGMGAWAANGFGMNDTIEQFAADHYRLAGKAEGRTGFAKGGAFGPGGIVTKPTAFQTGQGGAVAGEAGWEGALPLTNVGGRLGVFAQRGQSDNAEVVAELKATREQNERLSKRLEQVIAQLAEVLDTSNENAAKKVVQAVERGSTARRLRAGGG